MLKMPGRYYRTIPIDAMRHEATEVSLDPDTTALVVLHCWNIGCECGPEIDPGFFVGMGSREATVEAGRMMVEQIRPAMDAARDAGILVAHVEADSIAAKHPQAEEEADPPPAATGPAPTPTVPDWRGELVWRSHGEDYATKSPYAHMDRAAVVAPHPDEPMAYQTPQFHRQLSKRGIETLIYTGFATDMCILRAPGGVEPMAGQGYRTYLMRDATLGVELPDSFEERVATRWAIGYFETHFGDTLLTDDFIEACRGLA
ncbi:MAG TPA: cysteine hydrolase family protein [Armatimonadota bacterium]|nr:cysteine hydrolase family protein [Armatimonadota bacterium]